jgi:osmotically-inducible protein OsmY
MKNRFIIISFLLLFFNGCVGVSSTGIFGTGVSIALDPRSVGTQIDDSVMQKNLGARLILKDKNYLLAVKTKVLDGRIFITGKVDNPREKTTNYKISMGDKRCEVSKK